MGNHRNTKTEHAGAKNGGGFHGTRADAKKTSNRARRETDKAEARTRDSLYGERNLEGSAQYDAGANLAPDLKTQLFSGGRNRT